MRAFLAVSLPPEVRGALSVAGELLRRTDPSWSGEKWVRQANLHVTLRFLGNVPDDRAPWLLEQVAMAVADMEPFVWSFDRVEAVPRARAASMLWAVCGDDAGGGAALAARLNSIVLEDVAVDDRAFTPHVTLCRARRRRRVAPEALEAADVRLQQLRPSMSVEGVTLFASTLGARAPVYSEIGSVALGQH